MNVPVVTLEGDTHISRVGASLLTNLGLPQLVAHNDEEFVRIAAGYAKDQASLVELRKGLRERFRHSPVMDGKKFAAEFGAASGTRNTIRRDGPEPFSSLRQTMVQPRRIRRVLSSRST